MKLIQRISSTLRTWVFKKKLLRFSGRFRVEPEACFYCPEMCRFSCPVAETLRNNTVTPRGKMSLLHLAERGFPVERVTGTVENRQWLLEQCTGCGRCTEYCVYENDVASSLREERSRHFEKLAIHQAGAGVEPSLLDRAVFARLLEGLRQLKGTVLLCEPGRKVWWEARPEMLTELGVEGVFEGELPHREWSWGKLADVQIEAIGEALEGVRHVWVESPEAGWFLAKAVKEDREALGAEVRLVWQRFFVRMAQVELPPGVSFHESYHLTRLFPRLNYSIPMYERGLLPFHSGWNVLDCGGEGYYRLAHPGNALAMGQRFLADLVKDGRPLDKVVCQSLSCVGHLKSFTGAQVSYWLDELEKGQ